MPVLPILAACSGLIFKNWNYFFKIAALIFMGTSVWAGGFKSNSFSQKWVSPYNPPEAGNWYQLDVLKKIQELSPHTNRKKLLAILPVDSPYLNQISFRYLTIAHGLYDQIRPLGPGQQKDYLAFMDYVLDVDGDWDQNAEAFNLHQEVQSSDWFLKTYKEQARWKLPQQKRDLVLYRQEVQPLNIDLRTIKSALLNFEWDKDLNYSDQLVNIQEYSKEDSKRGFFKKITFKAKNVTFRGVPLGEVLVEAKDIQLNLPLLVEKKEVRILKLKALTPVVSVSLSKLQQFLFSQIKGYVSDLKIEQDFNQLNVKAQSRYGIYLEVGIKLSILQHEKNNWIFQEITKIKIGNFTVPRIFYKTFTDRKHSLNFDAGMPFDLEIKKINISEDKIKINNL